jgi:hypothetical protein
MLLVLTASAVCCTRPGASSVAGGDTPSPTASPIDARDRLVELGEAWFRTPATVSYRTRGQVPGQPKTAHLCLRQMFDDDFGEDRTALLRRCSQQGTLRLVWDPPGHWQMDVTSPIERFRLTSTPRHSLLCGTARDPRARCRSISSRRAQTASPFGFLLMAPNEILEEVGAPLDTVRASPARSLGSEHLQCFDASGPEEHVEWCYSRDGLLLSFLRGSAADGWTSIEATSVSR